MSDFNYLATVKRVVSREVAAARLAPDYSALVAHYGITHDSDSAYVTECARAIVVAGAHEQGTEVGKSITPEMLKGQDPGADAAHRVYWKATRAVRIGLVTALGSKDSGPTDPDYLAAIVKAAETALKHEISREDILNALAPLVG